MASVRVLLTEGSSLTAREFVSCLGPLGYAIEVLDPDPLCLARLSRWVRRLHRCPAAGVDPVGYIEFLSETVAARRIDAVLPTHEQAWLLAAGRKLFSDDLPVALANASSFSRVQSKLAFAQLLDELGVPQPGWRLVERLADLGDLSFPYWLKSPFSTAGRGVRKVVDSSSRGRAFGELCSDHNVSLIAQESAAGQYAQVQGLFDDGKLVAAHTSVQRGVGMGGSAAARLSAEHPEARMQLQRLGEALDWHGGLTLDYMHVDGSPSFIECNPRTVEPGNAAASGVNLPDLQARLTIGETLAPVRLGHAGIRTHATIALLLGVASRGGSRPRLLAELRDAATRRGLYADSSEQLTPVLHDPPSALPLAFVAARLLRSPESAAEIAGAAVERYSITPSTIATVTRA